MGSGSTCEIELTDSFQRSLIKSRACIVSQYCYANNFINQARLFHRLGLLVSSRQKNRNFLLRQEVSFLNIWVTNYFLYDSIFIVYSKYVQIVWDHIQFLFCRLYSLLFFVINVSHSRAAFGLMNPVNPIHSKCTALNSSLVHVITVIACRFFLNKIFDD